MANPHFRYLSKHLLGLLEDEFLLDVEITTKDKPVYLHKVIIAIYSDGIKEKFKAVEGTWKLDARGYSASAVQNLVQFLYDGDTDTGDKCSEIIRSLHLDLSVDQRIRKKKVSRSKGEKVENVMKLELKYLRDLTLEIGIPKLLKEPRILTDVKMRTGKDVHNCHKVILSAASEYFAAMFSSGMRESNDDIISLQGIETSIFVPVLNYIYTGKNFTTMANAQDILSTSVYLQLSRLQVQCEDFLLQHIDTNNCVDILRVADMYSCEDLVKGAIAFIVNQFSAINKLKLLTGLKFQDVVRIVSDDNLNTASENVVLSFVLDWMSHNQAEKNVVSLLKQVRLDLVDEKLLKQVLKENKLILNQPECTNLLQEALQLQRKGSVSSQPRKEETFVVLKRSSCFTGIEVACYSLSEKTWFKLQSFPSSAGGTGFSACSTSDEIFVSGGSSTPKSLYKFSVTDNKWFELADMNEGRYSHAMGCVQEMIYVLGGSSISTGTFDAVSSIEKYDMVNNTWTKVGDMAIPTFDSAFAVAKTQILVFGGSIASMCGVYIKDIQCFDTVTETCTTLYQNLPFTLSLATACVHNKDIYLTCPNGKIIHYSADTPPSIINQSKGSQLMGFATVYNNNIIYILGGYSLTGESDAIHKFSLKTMEQSLFRETKLPFPKQTNQLFATVMYVSRAFLNSESDTFTDKDMCSPRRGYRMS